MVPSINTANLSEKTSFYIMASRPLTFNEAVIIQLVVHTTCLLQTHHMGNSDVTSLFYLNTTQGVCLSPKVRSEVI